MTQPTNPQPKFKNSELVWFAGLEGARRGRIQSIRTLPWVVYYGINVEGKMYHRAEDALHRRKPKE